MEAAAALIYVPAKSAMTVQLATAHRRGLGRFDFGEIRNASSHLGQRGSVSLLFRNRFVADCETQNRIPDSRILACLRDLFWETGCLQRMLVPGTGESAGNLSGDRGQ